MAGDLDPVRLDPPRTSLLAVADPIPDGLDWWTEGVSLIRRPVGHPTFNTCVGGVDIASLNHPDGIRFASTVLDVAVLLSQSYALNPDTRDVTSKLADDLMTGDAAWALSRLLQVGNGAETPGMATVAGASALSTDGVATSGTVAGTAFSLGRGVGALLDWWAANGVGGMGVMHVPQILAPAMATARLLDAAQAGVPMVPGGLAWLSFGPGYDDQIGPRGTVAGANKAWIWMTSRVYASSRRGTHRSSNDSRTGGVLEIASTYGVAAFDTGAVAAVLVDLP